MAIVIDFLILRLKGLHKRNDGDQGPEIERCQNPTVNQDQAVKTEKGRDPAQGQDQGIVGQEGGHQQENEGEVTEIEGEADRVQDPSQETKTVEKKVIRMRSKFS